MNNKIFLSVALLASVQLSAMDDNKLIVPITRTMSGDKKSCCTPRTRLAGGIVTTLLGISGTVLTAEYVFENEYVNEWLQVTLMAGSWVVACGGLGLSLLGCTELQRACIQKRRSQGLE